MSIPSSVSGVADAPNLNATAVCDVETDDDRGMDADVTQHTDHHIAAVPDSSSTSPAAGLHRIATVPKRALPLTARTTDQPSALPTVAHLEAVAQEGLDLLLEAPGKAFRAATRRLRKLREPIQERMIEEHKLMHRVWLELLNLPEITDKTNPLMMLPGASADADEAHITGAIRGLRERLLRASRFRWSDSNSRRRAKSADL
jgi:hypothetical protein